MKIERLGVEHAAQIKQLFQRVYGDSYANETFYHLDLLRQKMKDGKLHCVGAIRDDMLIGHMAMTRQRPTSTPELGNTVVDPNARGDGVAWQVGAELMSWCREFGHNGYVHFPTTDHHIMQRRSVKQGFETGLMLGYIPAETDGKVGDAAKRGRSAATIVYEPFTDFEKRSVRCPKRYRTLVESLASRWREVSEAEYLEPKNQSRLDLVNAERRGLQRLVFHRIGRDCSEKLATLTAPCQQIDFELDDPSVSFGVELAWQRGFRFCGWLPEFGTGDVLRMQSIDQQSYDLQPGLENAGAKQLLKTILSES